MEFRGVVRLSVKFLNAKIKNYDERRFSPLRLATQTV